MPICRCARMREKATTIRSRTSQNILNNIEPFVYKIWFTIPCEDNNSDTHRHTHTAKTHRLTLLKHYIITTTKFPIFSSSSSFDGTIKVHTLYATHIECVIIIVLSCVYALSIIILLLLLLLHIEELSLMRRSSQLIHLPFMEMSQILRRINRTTIRNKMIICVYIFLAYTRFGTRKKPNNLLIVTMFWLLLCKRINLNKTPKIQNKTKHQ